VDRIARAFNSALLKALPRFLAVTGVGVSVGVAAWFSWFPPEGVSLSDRLAWYGVIVGAVSFWYTLLQLYLTKQAAIAAEKAAEAAHRKADADSYRFALERLDNWLQRATVCIDGKLWKMAAVKLRDTEWELLRVQYLRSHANDRWEEFTKVMRWWAEYVLTNGKEHQKIAWPLDRVWTEEFSRVRRAILEELGVTGVGDR
jgi:hypothetical protein